MILKGNTRKRRIKNPPRLVKEIDLSVDTGHMSHHNVPLPLKPRTALSAKIGEMLTSLDTTPKQILRQQQAGSTNKKRNKKRKEARIKRKQYLLNKKIKQNEKERIKQLFQEGIKNNQDNGNGQQKDCKAYVHDEVIKVCS
jgi:hypothetical protein